MLAGRVGRSLQAPGGAAERGRTNLLPDQNGRALEQHAHHLVRVPGDGIGPGRHTGTSEKMGGRERRAYPLEEAPISQSPLTSWLLSLPSLLNRPSAGSAHFRQSLEVFFISIEFYLAAINSSGQLLITYPTALRALGVYDGKWGCAGIQS